MKIKTFLVFTVVILLIALSNSQSVEIGSETTETGVNIFFPALPTFNNNTAFVNSSAFLITPNFGPINDFNSTQFFASNFTINILESWLELFGDSQWLNLSGGNANQNIDIEGFDFTTTGLGTFGNLDVDTLNFNGNVISDSTGIISFANDNLITTGDVGIGTTSLAFRLDVRDTTSGIVGITRTDASTPTAGGFILVGADDGAAMGDGHRLGGFLLKGSISASASANGGGVIAFADEQWSATSAKTKLIFEVMPSGSISADDRVEVLIIRDDGIVLNGSLQLDNGNINLTGNNITNVAFLTAQNICYSDGVNCTTLDNITNLSLNFLNLSGGNANQNINIGAFNFNATNLNAGTLNLASANITDPSGVITFDDEDLNTEGDVAIGINDSSRNYPLDIVGQTSSGFLQVRLGSSVTDATTKTFGFTGRHYTAAEEDVVLLVGQSTPTTTLFFWGGGGGALFNAATEQRFFARSSTISTLDIEVLRLENDTVTVFPNLVAQLDVDAGSITTSVVNIKGAIDMTISQLFGKLTIQNLNLDADIAFSINDGATQKDLLFLDASESIVIINGNLTANNLCYEDGFNCTTLDNITNLSLNFLNLSGGNANQNINISTFDFTSAGLGTFGELQVDDVNINGNEVSVTGGDLELSASGTIMMLADVDMQGSMIQDTGGDLNLDAQDDISFTNNNLISIVNLTATGLGTFGSLLVDGLTIDNNIISSSSSIDLTATTGITITSNDDDIVIEATSDAIVLIGGVNILTELDMNAVDITNVGNIGLIDNGKVLLGNGGGDAQVFYNPLIGLILDPDVVGNLPVFIAGKLVANETLNMTNNTIFNLFCLNGTNNDNICFNNSIDFTINNSLKMVLGPDNTTLFGDFFNFGDVNDTSSFIETNLNNGTRATAGFSARNDVLLTSTFGITGSNFVFENSTLNFSSSGNIINLGLNNFGFTNGKTGVGWMWIGTDSAVPFGNLTTPMNLTYDGALSVLTNITVPNISVENINVEQKINQTVGNAFINNIYGYAKMKNESGVVIDLVTQGVYVNITGINNGSVLNGVTYDGDHAFIINHSGTYEVSATVTFTGPSAKTFTFDFIVNDVLQNIFAAMRTSANAETDVSIGPYAINLNEGDVVTLAMADGITPVDPTILGVQFSLRRIGV